MKKTFVLRPHALLSSRNILLKFGNDNEIAIPIAVIDEIKGKKYESIEKSKIAKDFLDYINSFDIKDLEKGVVQSNGSILKVIFDDNTEKVFFPGLREPELRTLSVCKELQKDGHNVILVTGNPTLQLKANHLGIKAESLKDEIFPRLSEQYTGRGIIHASDDVIDAFYSNEGSINIMDISKYLETEVEFVENQFFLIKSESKSALAKVKGRRLVKLKYHGYNPYGAIPKNVGQKFMVEALLDHECPLVVIKGSAGTGKTYCALAAGLSEVDQNKYSRILVTRSVTATEQYGFLPGDIEEKLSPYLAGIKDNLSILLNGSNKHKGGNYEYYEDGSYFFEKGIVQIQAIGFLRGRSIVNTFFIIDETQNIAPDIIKSIVTRAAQGSKFIFLGDPTQVDNPCLTERYNGLVYLSEKMKGNKLCAQVSLTEDESVRSELAKEAAKIL